MDKYRKGMYTISMSNIFMFIQFLKEIEGYQGRDQQKKGYIMKNVQRRLFGEELPRGHGYKGKLSTKMSILYDELTGRQPRKRRTKNIGIFSVII